MFLKRLCCTLLVALLFSVSQLAFTDSRKASSLSEFFALIQVHTTMLEESFSVSCDPLVVEALEKKSSVGENDTVLSEIMSLAGCSGSFSYSCYDDQIQLSDVSYYAGWRIIQQYAAGKTNMLSAKEVIALNNALTLVSETSGTALEKERYLYDSLCGLVTYDATDDPWGEKDCAIGALVNHRADCDGYADAMLLCCYLAGIPCSMIHGQAIKSVQNSSDDNSHMWNLVFIENSWLMCDVTWGDQEGGPNYLYFNLGRQDASFSYLWDDSFLFKEIAAKADFNSQLMPDQRPFIISSYDDIYYAARNAALAYSPRLFLYSVNEQPLWQSDQDAFWSVLRHAAFGTCSYNESGHFFEIILVNEMICQNTAMTPA